MKTTLNSLYLANDDNNNDNEKQKRNIVGYTDEYYVLKQ